jgi:hypothetical protein
MITNQLKEKKTVADKSTFLEGENPRKSVIKPVIDKATIGYIFNIYR